MVASWLVARLPGGEVTGNRRSNSENPLTLCNDYTNRNFGTNGKHP